jgi:hypothetical protein
MPNLYKVQDHGRDFLGRLWLVTQCHGWGVFFSNAHNFSLTPKFATSFCPSYFTTQEASVTPIVSATRQVIQIDGLAFSSSPITRARGA